MILASELPPGRGSEALRALVEMRVGAHRVRDIVRDMKVFSRSPEMEGPLDLRGVLDSSAGFAFNEIRHRARFVKEYGSAPLVDANESRLGQVIVNLLINAAQAIPEGAADKNEIRMVLKTSPSGQAVIEVRDTGAGITQENLKRIFDPFFTTKPVGVGTGLGLFVCHSIVSSLHGEIAAESEPGKGTVLRISLPPSIAEKEHEEPRPNPSPRPRCTEGCSSSTMSRWSEAPSGAP